jgi:hypothetical protein
MCGLSGVNKFRESTDARTGKTTILNKVVSKDRSIMINSRHGLMSGDFDTAFTGTIISVIMALMVMEDLGYNYTISLKGGCVNIKSKDFSIYDNGDDILIFTKHPIDSEAITREYATHGFLSRFDGVTNTFYQTKTESGLEFCRHRPTGEGEMVRTMSRTVMNTFQTGKFMNEACTRVMMFIKSYVSFLLYRNIPPLARYFQEVCEAQWRLLAHLGEVKIRRLIKSQFFHNTSWWEFTKYEDAGFIDDLLPLMLKFNGFARRSKTITQTNELNQLSQPHDIVESSTTIEGCTWMAFWHIHYAPSKYFD